MQANINIKIEVSNKQNAEKIAKLLQNIIDNVNEDNLIGLYENIEKDYTFFKKIMKAIKNPLVKKIFGNE